MSVDTVLPRCLVQLNLSLESCDHEQKSISKSQLNFPLADVVGAAVLADVVGMMGTALCGRTTHVPTVNAMSSMAISPW